MMENVIVALITGGLSFLGVMFSNVAANRKIEQNLITSQAVTDTQIRNLDTKISMLAEEVRKHNSFADRITRLEADVENIKEKIERS